MSKVVVSDIEPWSDRGGWKWTRTLIDDDGNRGVTLYRTNADGEGLFSREWHENAWSQSHGTLQYSMPGTEAGVRKRLFMMYAELGEVEFKD